MKTLKNWFFLPAICCLLTTTLLGCVTSSNQAPRANTPGMLEPQSILKFSDVPVPVGLKSLPLESYSFESSGVRVGVLKYEGKDNADQVINFYKEQMPMYSWTLVNLVEYGQRLMNFERENESCIITLQPAGWGKTLVIISIGPKSQTTSRKAKSPLK